ncbi:hypothetical protein K438DRAFT_1816438 [Mycena galopus ATCC 62051]|nr:hypothetical protein K438DRAFT_1816438 [Mycena galopus ATCC 62051]
MATRWHPRQDPGAPVTLTLNVFMSDQKQRVDINFDVMNLHVGCHDSCCDEKIETFYREFIVSIGPELMHNSEAWGCLLCGRPATDMTWFSLYFADKSSPHRCGINIMATCEECRPQVQDIAPRVARLELQRVGTTHDRDSARFGTIPRPDTTRGGLSGACLACNGEQTASPDFTMLRCGQCKLVRYCSAACQKKDWVRHKKICRKIHVCRSTRV